MSIRFSGHQAVSFPMTEEQCTVTFADLPQQGALTGLRRRWWLVASVYTVSLLLGYGLLSRHWQPLFARWWFILAACVLSYELWLLRCQLGNNHRRGETRLLPTLGLGNMLTLLRGLAIGWLAGFLCAARPTGELAWIPGLLYTFAAVGDYLDGYLSRLTHHVTELGETLDREVDALGVLIAALLAVRYEQLPVWYVSIGLVYYLFSCGLWWRKRRGQVVYALPPSVNRRVIGGFQSGFLSIVLWPLFSPPGTLLAGTFLAIPLMASFLRDWCVVSGWIDPASPTYLQVRRKMAFLLTWWLPVLLRTVVVVGAVQLILLTVGGALFRSIPSVLRAVPSPRSTTVILCLMAATATTMLALGVAGRLAALVLLVTVCADILNAGFHLHNGLVLVGTIGIMLLGTGAFSLWQPEDTVLSRRLGEGREA